MASLALFAPFPRVALAPRRASRASRASGGFHVSAFGRKTNYRVYSKVGSGLQRVPHRDRTFEKAMMERRNQNVSWARISDLRVLEIEKDCRRGSKFPDFRWPVGINSKR